MTYASPLSPVALGIHVIDEGLYYLATNVEEVLKEIQERRFQVLEAPTGFENRIDSDLYTVQPSYAAGPDELTVTVTHVNDFSIFVQGLEIIKTTTDTVVISAPTDGVYWIYYDSVGTLTASTIPFDFSDTTKAPVVVLYWDDSNSQVIYFGDERHGTVMDAATHALMHDTIGTRYESGLTISGYTLSTDSNAAVSLGVAGGVIHDEDIAISIVDDATPDTYWEQDLSDPAKIPIFYRDGAAGNWRKIAATDYPFHPTGSGRLAYDNVGVGLTEGTNNYYIAYWIFATNDINNPIISIIGQREDFKLIDAKTNNNYESLAFGTLPFQEMKVLYRIILQTKDAYTNAIKSTIEDVADYRALSTVATGTYVASSHSVLSDLSNDDHTQYLLADGTRALTGDWAVGAHAISGITTLGMTGQLTNTLAIGTPPFVITSTDVVANLNVDQVDGYDLDQALLQASSPTFVGLTLSGAITGLTDLTMTGAIATPTNISMTGQLDMTGVGAKIDLNPSATGTQYVIDLVPSANLVAGSAWYGLFMSVNNLDPAAGVASTVTGFYIDGSGLVSVDSNATFSGFQFSPSPVENSFALVAHPREITINKQFMVMYSYSTLVLSATAVYRGWHQDWHGMTADAGAPIVIGINAFMPDDYTGFGASYAAYFTGDGRSVKICDTTYALSVVGAMLLNGVITGIDSITLDVGATIDEFSIDGTLVGNSDSALPTEQAVKTYVDAQIAAVNSLAEVLALGNEADGTNLLLDEGADLIVYSDDKVTEVARIDGATGNITTIGTVDTVDIAALKTDVDGFPDELKSLVTAEIQQLENIDASTISVAQWGYLGALDQALTQASSPTFVGLTLSGAITGVTTLSMSGQLTNTLAIGTPPFVITSTDVVANLNVDMVDGYHLDQGVLIASTPTFGGLTINGAMVLNGAITGVNSITCDLGASINEFSIDGTLAGNSDSALPTEKAVKTYVTAQVATVNSLAEILVLGNEADGTDILLDQGADLIVYSDDKVTEVARIDGATGNITTIGTVDGVDVAALKTDVDGFPDELKSLVTAEIQQLENIGATTISIAQWGYLGALDQSLTQASSPTFIGLTLSGAITGVTTISAGGTYFTVDASGNTLLSVADATVVLTMQDSATLELKGKYWTGAVTADAAMLIGVDVTATTPEYEFFIKREDLTKVFSMDELGNGMFLGDLTVANLITAGNVDGVDVSAIVAFKTITGITNDVVADSLTDSLTLATANNLLTIVGTAATDTITFTVVEANISHDAIADVSADDHHAQSHALTTHSDVVLADPGTDQIVFWDDSDSKFEFLVANTGLSILGNNLNCDITQYTDGLARTACLEDDVYGVGWDGDVTHAPTQNALYDKIAAMDILIAANTTVVEVEAVITAEIVNGQSIDNAIDALINTHNAADTHVAHSGVTITAGIGLSGGGTIAASRTIDCDITQYTDAMAQAACVSDAAYGAGWDAVVDVAPSKNAVYDQLVTHYANADAHHAQAHTHDGDTLQLDGINSDGGAFAFTTSGVVQFNNALAGITDLSMSGQLDMTGAGAWIDLNPAATGTQDIISIVPTAALVAGSIWTGISQSLGPLDPAAGGVTIIRGFEIVANFLESVDGNLLFDAIVTNACPADDTNMFRANVTELTADKIQIGFLCDGGSKNLSATGTYQGLHIDWDGITRDLGAPVLQGARVQLPADYSNFGVSYAGYFSGDGRSVTICDTTYALNVSGAMNLVGAVTGITSLGVSGAIATATNISMSGELDLTGAGACIDLNPSGTGAKNIIDITPSAAIAGGANWKAIYVNGAALDPGAAGSEFRGLDINFTGVDMTNNPSIYALIVTMPAVYGTATERAAHFSGDGRTVIICEDARALNVTGAMLLTGAITGVTNLTMSGILSVGTYTDIRGQYIQIFETVNDGNPYLQVGATTSDNFYIQAVYNAGLQTLDYVRFYSVSSAAGDGRIQFYPDTVLTLTLHPTGNVDVAGDLTVSGGNMFITSSTQEIRYLSSSPIRGLVYNAGISSAGWYGIHRFQTTGNAGANEVSFEIKNGTGVSGWAGGVQKWAFDTLGNLQIDGDLQIDGGQLKSAGGSIIWDMSGVDVTHHGSIYNNAIKILDIGTTGNPWDECYADNWNNVSSWKTFSNPLDALRGFKTKADDPYEVDHNGIDDWLRSRIKARIRTEEGLIEWEGGYVLKPEKAKTKARKVFMERLGKKVPVGNYSDGYSDEDFEHENAYSINKTQIVLIQAIKQLEQRVKDLEAGS